VRSNVNLNMFKSHPRVAAGESQEEANMFKLMVV